MELVLAMSVLLPPSRARLTGRLPDALPGATLLVSRRGRHRIHSCRPEKRIDCWPDPDRNRHQMPAATHQRQFPEVSNWRGGSPSQRFGVESLDKAHNFGSVLCWVFAA